jgi:rubredoxin
MTMGEGFVCPRCKTIFVGEMDDVVDDDELPITCPVCFLNFDPDAPAREKPIRPSIFDLPDTDAGAK